MPTLDQIWLALAWLVGLAGAALTLWALFSDCPRGRARCRECVERIENWVRWKKRHPE